MNGKVGVFAVAQIKGKYTTEFVPVKDIKNGTIILDNNLKVTGVKIMPRNLFILDRGTQAAMISNLRNVYNTIDYEFWVIAADRPVDISVYLSQLQLLYQSISDPIRRKLCVEDINKGNYFINNNIVDTEYYLLFKEKDEDKIQKRLRNLITQFANAGLTCFQTTNEDLRIILDNFLNGGQSTTFGTVMSGGY